MMEKMLLCLLVLLIVSNCVLKPSGAQECANEYQISTTAYLNYTLKWSLKENVINFTVTVQLVDDMEYVFREEGLWIGLGFSNKTKRPFMFPADVIIGFFETETDRQSDILDMYTVSHSEPLTDDITNIMNPMTFSNNITSTYTMSFSRTLVTNDAVHDVRLDVPRYWIWAVGPLNKNGELIEHLERGNISNSPITLPSVKECSSIKLGHCGSSVSTDSETGTITWPESVIGAIVNRSCPFGPVNATASRMCVSDSNWTAPEVTRCATAATRGLKNLQEDVDRINVSDVALFITNLSSFVSNARSFAVDQTEENALIVSIVLLTIWDLFQTNSENVSLSTQLEVIAGILFILDDIEEWSTDNIQNESTIIVRTFETFARFLVSQEDFDNLTLTTENITFFGNRVDANSLQENGKSFAVNQATSGVLQFDTVNHHSNNELQDDHPAIFSFPSGIDIQELFSNDEDKVGIFITAYHQDRLFFDSANQSDDWHVGSDIIVGFSIAGLPEGTDLPQPVSVTLRIADPATGSSENISDVTCVFYNFTTTQWDSTGCETIYDPGIDPSNVTCRCSHLTNFACLVSIGDRIGADGDPSLSRAQVISLEVFTYIGVVLSLIGLLATFISLIAFKKIRQHDVTKFHLQLCVSLACMYIVFVCGIDSTDNRGGCVTVGTMIQYFTLVAWMWMGAEALLMFQHLIFVFVETTWKYILIVSVVCWSVPIVFVVIPISINPDYYITTFDDNTTTRLEFCFISDVAVFFGAFLGPIFLVIIFNTIVFVVFIYVLIKHYLRRNKFKINQPSMTALEMLKAVLSVCGVMVLFGFSWILVIFTFTTSDRDVSFIFQLMFVFFNAFQGLWIFLFFVVVNKETRNSWRKFLCQYCRMKSSYYNFTLKTTASSTINDNLYSTTASLVGTGLVEQPTAETPLIAEESIDKVDVSNGNSKMAADTAQMNQSAPGSTANDVNSSVYSTTASIVVSKVFKQLDNEKALIKKKVEYTTKRYSSDSVYSATASLVVSKVFKQLDLDIEKTVLVEKESQI